MIPAEPVDLQVASYTASRYEIKAEDREVIDGMASVRDAGTMVVRCRSQQCYDIETGESAVASGYAKDGIYVFFWDMSAQ